MKKILSILFLLGVTVTTFNVANISFADTATLTKPSTTVTEPVQVQAPIVVKPLDVIKNPTQYMNKTICMTSKFSKFATLGLDYKPAFRNSDKYITFLFLREDAVNNIPLSELKIFIKRDIAEKLPDIKEGDKVKVVGTLFSDALGDAWVDVEKFDLVK